ncbi:hypothetical protein DDZ18_03050 [Marinicauda salina]|jgi:hypothetical protein|uniref:Pilus assembly protein CpaD n=1 Tax=Marinicauda salina TaxID=2135793 RepID=A0A2U2BX54_9PROT|nr:hypothetical protein [Marinicauda salina]PWE18596.1 hypothetical protein DDZ18_03050 [Marinicauda salina]
MKRFAAAFAAASAALAASACANINEPLSPLHGQFAETNFEAMVDDPRPVEGDPEPSARVIDAAVDRYQSGDVIPPRTSEAIVRRGSGG